MADGPDGPLPDPRLIASVAGLVDPEVVLGWVVRAPGWIETAEMPVTTLLTGPGTRAAVESGRVRSLATRLSAVPVLLAERIRPAVAVVGAVPAGETEGDWRVYGSPGWAVAAARHADAVVIERWPGRPLPGSALLGPEVAGRVAAVIDRGARPDPPPQNRPGPAHRRIGELIAGLIPDGATVQWGPGVVGASVVDVLTRPVRVRSGLVTEELVALESRGLLEGTAEAAYVWGGEPLRRMIEAGTLKLSGVDHIHDISAVSAIDRFVAINTALEVGLDGAVNVEIAGGRIVAGPGGHPDFAAGASRSRGGLSIIGLPSTAGGRSTIVARPAVVSTPRSDVDVVVTEHGVADLRGCVDRERARRMVAIAHPEHASELREAAGVE
jgi:acyl-CoA hydrolase